MIEKSGATNSFANFDSHPHPSPRSSVWPDDLDGVSGDHPRQTDSLLASVVAYKLFFLTVPVEIDS